MLCESISTGAQYVTLYNKIKCLSLAVFLWQPHPQNCDWNCMYVGTTSSKPPGAIIMIQFVTLFFGGAQLCLEVHAVTM
jgi:hypothetical protein